MEGVLVTMLACDSVRTPMNQKGEKYSQKVFKSGVVVLPDIEHF